MKIYLTKHGGLYLEIVQFQANNYDDAGDFDVRLAGELVLDSRKIEIVEELKDACEEFLELQSQEFMKQSVVYEPIREVKKKVKRKINPNKKSEYGTRNLIGSAKNQDVLEKMAYNSEKRMKERNPYES
jgi:hypothetical protein